MLDGNLLLTTVLPALCAAIGAYAIARYRSNSTERVQKAKIEADVDTKVMEMVRSIMEDMRTELKAEIEVLRKENSELREVVKSSTLEIESLQRRLHVSSEIQSAMKIEIASLTNTIQWYEKRLASAENNT